MKMPLFLAVLIVSLCAAVAEEPSRVLLGPDVEGWEAMVKPNGDKQQDVTFTTGGQGVTVSVEAGGGSSFPGVRIQPTAPWDVSSFGRVEATVVNTSEKPMRLSMRVDDAASESGTTSAVVPPNETRVLAVYLDFAGKSKLKSSAIKAVLIFGSKAPGAQSFRIEKIVAAGPAGERPPVDPKTQAVKPPKGVLLGEGVTFDAAKQLVSVGAGKGSAEAAAIKVALSGQDGEGVTFKPAQGFWNLNEFFQVRVRVKNTGTAPITPSVRLESKEGPSDVIPAAAPIAPGQEGEILATFAAKVPWEGVTDDPDVDILEKKKNFKGKPGTGTSFVSHRMTGVTILGDKTPGNLLVTSIAGENPADLKLPEWLGQRPPVEGEWSKTFEDNFEGDSVDLTKWNIYSPNFWDKRTHFTKDNAIVKDGTLTLRVERKTGRHNDSPDGKETDYATGFADTYGKWTQRYGYFEARVKLPTAPCLWPAFWLMPDRGLGNGDQGRRQSTRFGGMEFDIIEQLSAWGPQRFNLAMHWDGYGSGHKATGSGNIYVPADKDGYIVVGLLWTPEEAILYANGEPVGRWNNPRISNVASAILLDNVTGGWETEPLDDSQLPGDFVIDYVRVWQRSDLASPADGPKPNKGTPAAPTE